MQLINIYVAIEADIITDNDFTSGYKLSHKVVIQGKYQKDQVCAGNINNMKLYLEKQLILKKLRRALNTPMKKLSKTID